MKTQTKKIREYDTKILGNQMKINEQESTINELKKKMEEWDQKFADFTSEINRTREEAQKYLNASKHNVTQTEEKQQQQQRNVCKIYETNIKPRTSFISLPFSTTSLDTIRKRQSTLQLDLPNKIPKRNTIREDITNLINDNITNNISKTITEKFITPKPSLANTLFKRHDFSTFITTSIETLLKNPVTNIKSRKRKINEIAI